MLNFKIIEGLVKDELEIVGKGLKVAVVEDCDFGVGDLVMYKNKTYVVTGIEYSKTLGVALNLKEAVNMEKVVIDSYKDKDFVKCDHFRMHHQKGDKWFLEVEVTDEVADNTLIDFVERINKGDIGFKINKLLSNHCIKELSKEEMLSEKGSKSDE